MNRYGRRRAIGSLHRRRWARLLVAAGLVAGTFTAVAAPASAAPAWSTATSPSPNGPPGGSLGDVACASAKSCFAVGSGIVDAFFSKALIERLNGKTWSVAKTPNPAGAVESRLNGVSCPSTTSCIAVGEWDPGFDGSTLVEQWNGTSWAIIPSPTPDGAVVASLSSVACTDAASCIAVGSYLDDSFDSQPLVEQWNGAGWSIIPSPSPAHAFGSSLGDISCVSATNCFAVGSSQDSSFNGKTLVEAWNGASWSIVASPNPAGANSTSLSSVACASAKSCFAVGSTQDSSFVSKTLVEKWNGTKWLVVASPNPAGSVSANLSGVTCVSAKNCLAVGSNENSPSASQTLVEQWNGTSWAIIPDADPSGAVASALGAVVCSGGSNCTAVGAANGTFVEHWSGSAWAIVPPPAASSQSQLAQVSCTTTTTCFAVGSSVGPSGAQLSLIEQSTAATWSVAVSPNPAGATATTLNGVACPTATSCFAVGSATIGGIQQSLAERWNGASWSIVASPNPAASTGTVLNGISCPSATTCFAVGEYTTSTVDQTLIEKWNGTQWSQVTSPSAGSFGLDVNRVSCASTTSCMAVGSVEGGTVTGTVVLQLDGTKWSSIAGPHVGGTFDDNILYDVSCPASTSCYVAGDHGLRKPLIAHWDGTGWTVAATSHANGAFNGLACVSDTSCMAVGYTSTSTTLGSGGKTLSEQWNGATWTLVTTPNPSGATYSFLNGVSCPAAANCTAVGASIAHASRYTLVENYG